MNNYFILWEDVQFKREIVECLFGMTVCLLRMLLGTTHVYFTSSNVAGKVGVKYGWH